MKIIGTNSPKILSDQLELPLMPLRDIVVFPNMVVPLYVGRERSIKAIEYSMKKDKLIFVATQKKAKLENPKITDIYNTGTICEILHALKLPNGNVKILLEGIARGEIVQNVQIDEFYKITIKKIQTNDNTKNLEIEALSRNLTSEFEKYAKTNRKITPEYVRSILSIEDFPKLVDAICAQVILPTKEKQELLSIYDSETRARKLLLILKKEIEIIGIEKKIHEKVKEQIEKNQHDYYLNEQLKAIKKELGHKDEIDDLVELKKELKKVKMTKEAWEKCEKELKRLERMPPLSPESSVIRTYLEWFKDLPWSNKTKDNKDIDKAAKILDEDHYGLKKPKERILEFIAVRQLAKKTKGQILCFVGPPGVGKTSLARSIARALGRNFIRISLGGIRDEAEIRGHRRTYVGALPGRILQGMKKSKSTNPVFLLDEVDKMSTDFRGDPSAALLEVLDPEQNKEFSDHYLEVSYDLSDVFFITTANTLYKIPTPLLDRMEVINLPGYTEDEKLNIAKQFLIKKQLKENGLKADNLIFTKNVILDIIRYYTREAGVRELERNIASICRKVAKIIVKEGKSKKITVLSSSLHKYLGPKKYRYSEAEQKDEIGVATGLAWTEAGGDILAVEVSIVKGKGTLTLTGKLGEIMQESAHAALSFARSRVKEYKLPENFYRKSDIHIHVPEGAIPKDGPSAGITIATALISALSKIPVKHNVAMTGEITLRGKVLPIGGLKEKILAAHRAQITEVIIPKENKKDFEDIPKVIQRKIKFHFVESMDEVLKIALSEPPKEIEKKKIEEKHSFIEPAIDWKPAQIQPEIEIH